MNCPRCQKPLVPGRLSEHSVLENVQVCETCKGSFIGPDALQKVEMQQNSTLFEFRRIPDATEQQKPLPCPRCAIAMDKVKSDRDEKVIMDYCPKCQHTWLDGGEIEAMQTDSFVANLISLFRGPKV